MAYIVLCATHNNTIYQYFSKAWFSKQFDSMEKNTHNNNNNGAMANNNESVAMKNLAILEFYDF